MTEREIRDGCKTKFDEYEKDITGIKKSMFGDDGLGGVLGCLKGKVSKKNIMRMSVGIAAIFAMFIVAGMTSWGDAKEKISDNKASISVIQSELEHIKTTTDKIEKNQMKPDELLKEIRKIIIGHVSFGGENDNDLE